MRSPYRLLLTVLFSMLLLGCGSGGGDRAGINSIKNVHTATGTVSGADNVTFNLSGSNTPPVSTVAPKGTYNFNDLPNGTYTLTPLKNGYTFSPASIAISINGANITIPLCKATVNGASTYILSGTVSGAVTQDVLITLSGAGNATTTTDATGKYSFSGLTNGSYTATPTLPGYSFAPGSSLVTVNNSNATFKDFVATIVANSTYTLSGKVSGDTREGVTINLSSTVTPTTSTQTDANGNYTFTGLANGDYTLTPLKSGYSFTPVNTAVTVSGANTSNANFTAFAYSMLTYSLSGTVSGPAIQNVVINLSGAGVASTLTNVGGNYSFSGLVNGSYIATPSLTGYSFTPASTQATINNGNATFGNLVSAVEVVPTYTISGTVSGDTKQGVTIQLTGAATRIVTTDVNGSYSFTGLANGNYTLTPGKTGYIFNPGNTAVNVSGANTSGANFSATASVAPTNTISGSVTGAVTQNVLITLSGAGTATTSSNASGNFTFTGLANGSYTVTPSLAGYTFSPGNSLLTINNADVTLSGFVSTAVVVPAYTITGTVSGATAQGVTISLTGAATKTTTTDASGNYSFASLANGSYTITPTKTGYTFNPGNTAVNVSGANTTGANFSATATVAPTYTLAGSITGVVVQNVLITLSGAGNATTTTNASGNYTFTGLANGSYTITPSLAGYTFGPTSAPISINGSNAILGQIISNSVNLTGSVGGATLSGVTISLSGTEVKTTTTDVNGGFKFAVVIDGSYTITPTKSGYTFNPPSAAVNIIGASLAVPVFIANVNNVGKQLIGGTIQGAALKLVASVSTFAGSGAAGSLDASGISASFNNPTGITTDGNNLYVADYYNHRIRKIEIATGVVSTLAGTGNPGSVDGVGTLASFNKPGDITTDGINLYVSDYSNYKIRKVVIATGVVTTLAGSGTSVFADGTGTSASFVLPTSLTIYNGNLYLTDSGSNRIRKVDVASGVVTTFAGSGSLSSVDGNAATASFNNPAAITTDGNNLFVAEWATHKIRMIVIATGVVTTVAGSGIAGELDGIGKAATFNQPNGITTDGTNLYISDQGGNKIRKIVISNWSVSTLAGSGIAGSGDGSGASASFSGPLGLTSDGSSLYIGDAQNNKIRKIQ